MATTEGRRRSDAARSRSMRERILTAAVESLIADGYAATSIGAIQTRAGISRGALLHQYPSKAQLLVDAVRFLSDQQLADLSGDHASEGESDWMTVLWKSFATPLFGAVLELWVAARTDDDLAAALLRHQRDLYVNIRESIVRATLGPLPDNFNTLLDMTLTYYRGLALTAILSDRHRDEMLADWSVVIRAAAISQQRPPEAGN